MRRSLLLIALGASAIVLATGPASSRAQKLANGHPDFSGVWFPVGRAVRTPNPLPFTDAAKKLVDEFNSQFTDNDDSGRYCIWPGMPRVIWGAPFAIEIIHRPQDMMIYWEGYGMYRKIYMADGKKPEPILPTAMGYSLAHWEGDTFVIETTHLKEYPIMDNFPTTDEAHVTERYHREQREINGEMRTVLVADVVLEDPRMYTEPVKINAAISLEPDMYIMEYTCSTTLWEEYLARRGLKLPDLSTLPEP